MARDGSITGVAKTGRENNGRPKGSGHKVGLRDLKVLEAKNEGKSDKEAMAAGGFKATNSYAQWAARPAVKAMLDWNERNMRQRALEKGFDTLDYILKLISVRRRMARYLKVNGNGLPYIKFPENITETDDSDLPTYVSVTVRTIGRGDSQQTIEEIKVNYPDDNTTAMNFAKLNGELVDQSRIEVSTTQDSDIHAAREYVRQRRETTH